MWDKLDKVLVKMENCVVIHRTDKHVDNIQKSEKWVGKGDTPDSCTLDSGLENLKLKRHSRWLCNCLWIGKSKLKTQKLKTQKLKTQKLKIQKLTTQKLKIQVGQAFFLVALTAVPFGFMRNIGSCSLSTGWLFRNWNKLTDTQCIDQSNINK